MYGHLFQTALSISGDEVTFRKRRFWSGDPVIRERLENVGRAFLTGYHLAIREKSPDNLCRSINLLDPMWRGFAFEGAGMGAALVDSLSTRRNRLLHLLSHDLADQHVYLIHTGAGWARARLPWLHRNDRPKSLFEWLSLDGWGFHDAYFNKPSVHATRYLRGFALQVYRQGQGRCLWFSQCADVHRIIAAIASQPLSTQDDYWSGVGLACGYAGGASTSAIQFLIAATGTHFPAFAQGVVFAAKARTRAGSVTDYLIAVSSACGSTVDEMEVVADGTLHALGDQPTDYKLWQSLIRDAFREGRIGHETMG